MKEAFISKNFLARTLVIIEQINSILDEYQEQGFALTLRQLHYQYVARGLMPNTEKTYTYLGATLRDARMAGLVDWDAIEDRTRETIRWPSWSSPAHLIKAAEKQYAEDPWKEHDVRLFVWVEKSALANIVEPACRDYGVPYFAVRGYSSMSELYSAGEGLSAASRRRNQAGGALPWRPRPVRHSHAEERGGDPVPDRRGRRRG